MDAFLNALQKLIETLAPALAVMLWNYEETKVEQADNAKADAQLELKLEKNHEAIDSKYADSSDADIVNDAILNGGGPTGQLETDNAPDGADGSTTGNGLGQVESTKKAP
jgi:hypothetical protein